MIIASDISSRLRKIKPGRVFSIADFDVPQEHQSALVKALNRRAQTGELRKIAKGKFFKPQNTMFGEVSPDIYELVKDYIQQGNNVIGYVTGTQAFAQMGLTTQISTEILIATNSYRKPKTRNGYHIRFITQKNKIQKADIELLRLLDAMKSINDIPATTVSEVVYSIIHLVKRLDAKRRLRLVQLAKAYQPKVRALAGAIMDYLGHNATELKATLNGVSTYKLGIDQNILPTVANWNIK